MLLLCALIAGSGTVWAEEYETLFSITSGAVVNNTTTYSAYTKTIDNRDFVITFGGNKSSVGTNKNNRSNCTLSSYSKYAVSPVTTSSIASAFACATSISDVSKISYTYNGGSSDTSTNVYLLYSPDNNTFSQISLSSGTQGATISSGTAYTFSAKTGYFALLFESTNSSGNWRIDNVEITFYKTKEIIPIDLTSFAFGTTSDAVQLNKNGSTWEASYTQTVTVVPNDYDGTVAYSIDEDASTIGENTLAEVSTSGVVTIVADANEASTIVVKASGTATSSYNKPADATYTLTVNKAIDGVGTPEFSQEAGSYYYNTKVEITSVNAGAIYYTTNGDIPSKSSTLYNATTGVLITGDMTLKAIGYDGETASDVATIVYTLKAPEAPTFSVTGGEVKAGTTVTLTAGEGGSVVVYTTDGSVPTIDSDIYDGPIAVNTAMTIKAATVDDGDNLSAVATASFTIKQVDEFVKVTDASTLRAGDQLILVYEDGNLALGAINSGGKYYEKADVAIVGGVIEDPTGTAVLTLGGEEGAWTLKSSLSSNYLSLTSSANELKAAETVSGNDTENWTISITDGVAKIINVAYPTDTKGNDRYIQWNTGSPRFACYGGSQKDLTLYRLSKSVTITAAEYATYAGAKALNFNGVGIKVYTATDNKTSVTLNEIASGKVPANTPVVLYKEGADGTAISVPVIASAEAVGDNDLQVSTGTDVANMYVLAMNPTIGFYPWAGDSDLSAGKVYLQGKASYGARAFIGFDDNETTGIIPTAMQPSTEPYYDLQGRRVAQPTKGLYIVNGKKVVIK